MKQQKMESIAVIEAFKILIFIFMLLSPNICFAQSELIVDTTQIISEFQEEEGLLSVDSLLLNEASLKEDSVGTVTTILSLPQGNSPEGIAIDQNNNLYISNTRGTVNEILHVEPNGSYSIFARMPGNGRAHGLVTDKKGSVYVAFKTEDPNTNGVYQIDRDGTPIHLAGSEQMSTPNALTFDDLGNLYVTDSYKGKNFEGSVWCYSKTNQVFKLFIKDPLLDGGVPLDGPKFPLPGANGIAFFPPNKLYVANTKESSIICIRIGEFGNEPTIELIKKDSLLLNIDGIVVDKHENIYGVLPASTLNAIGAPSVPPLIKLDTKSGEVSSVVEDNFKFDTPTSLDFRKTVNGINLFIANAALQYGQPPSAGPGVVRVRVEAISIKDK